MNSESPFEGQKFKSFEALKDFLQDYGNRNYIKFWVRSSHTVSSVRPTLAKRVNPRFKYVYMKFACVYGGEKIRSRSTGKRKSLTYRHLGCPCVVGASIGEDGNHVKLDTVFLQHNHVTSPQLFAQLSQSKKQCVGKKITNSDGCEEKVEGIKGDKTPNPKKAQTNLKYVFVKQENQTENTKHIFKQQCSKNNFKTFEESSTKKDSQYFNIQEYVDTDISKSSKHIGPCYDDYDDGLKVAHAIYYTCDEKASAETLYLVDEKPEPSFDDRGVPVNVNMPSYTTETVSAEKNDQLNELAFNDIDYLTREEMIVQPGVNTKTIYNYLQSPSVNNSELALRLTRKSNLTVKEFITHGKFDIEATVNDGSTVEMLTVPQELYDCQDITEEFYKNELNYSALALAENQEPERINHSTVDNLANDELQETELPVCRLCLQSHTTMTGIFSMKSTLLAFKIMACASIEVVRDDLLPNTICHDCEERLEIAFQFRIQCENADTALRETFKEQENKINEQKVVKEAFQPYPNPESPTCVLIVTDNTPADKDTSLSCPVCGISFHMSQHLLDHLQEHEYEIDVQCNFCSVVCKSSSDLYNHLAQHLEIGQENTSDLQQNAVGKQKKTKTPKTYLCYKCGKVFNTKERFESHENSHKGLKPHICSKCGKGFADRKNMNQHYDIVHLRKASHSCPVCCKRFYTPTKMKSHLTVHYNIKPFTCAVCNKTFRLKMNLSKHMKTHTNHRPHQCDKCPAAFIDKNMLKRHSFIHGGLRPYPCNTCGHRFSVLFHLKKHLEKNKCRSVQSQFPLWQTAASEVKVGDDECVGVDVDMESELLNMALMEYGGDTVVDENGVPL